MTRLKSVVLGSNHLVTSQRLQGRRVGIVCNPASVNAQLRHVIDHVQTVSGTTIVALFGPQHGFYSVDQDNMVETSHTEHPRYGIPVYSLYSDKREPTLEMLHNLDLLIIDLQDVGTRVYTYIYTMANCLRAAQRHGVKVIVCDRPNPIGGIAVEGPVLKSGFESFVGQFAIPLRHGMTIGELSYLFNQYFEIGAELEVIPMTGWTRSMYHDETGQPWVMPSPNLPTIESAIAYPGGVLFEGTNLSEGRGTTRPFELIGAPWINPDRLVETLSAFEMPGVIFRPIHFQPTFQKHMEQVCGGCQLHITDRMTFRPVHVAITIMQAFQDQDRAKFQWRDPPYEYEQNRPPIDILSGTDQLRYQIDTYVPANKIAEAWEPEIEAFEHIRQRFLIYD